MTDSLKSSVFLLLLACSALSCMTFAAQSQNFGEYTIHYIAVNSSFITPEIADRYGIVRSSRNAFINVSVIKNTSSLGTAVPARVVGEKANFLGQNTVIDFIEVREGDAVYYLGQFEFSNAENLRFTLEIQPENSGPSYPISWTTQLYIN